MQPVVDASEGMLYRCLLFWTGTNSHVDQPFLDSGADHIRMVFLQVMKAGAKLHQSAVLESLGKVLGKGWRYNSTRVSREKQLRISRLC